MYALSMQCSPTWYFPGMSEDGLPPPTFGEWLDDQLKQRGWSRPRLSRITGYSPATIEAWVNGRRNPRENACDAIADAFGVDRNMVRRLAGRPEEIVQVPADAGTEVPLTDPLPSGHYSRDDIRAIARSVVEEMGGFVSIRILGYVPADTTRWAAWEHEDRSMPFPREMLGSRSPDQFFVLIASGDCLIRRGISDGAYVLVRKLDAGERPQHDRMVVVRVGSEYTLKVWSIEDGRTRLRDGDGNLIAELDTADDVQVIGVVVSATNVF